jgi:hypothetical protein
MKNKTIGIMALLAAIMPERPLDGSCCPTCGSDRVQPDDFKDDLSRREFKISHMCQNCQDNVFESEDLMDG